MALYLPPTLHENQLNGVFNNVDFTYQTGSTSLSVTDARYLKIAGGNIIGNLNVSNAISCGTLTVNSEVVNGNSNIQGDITLGLTSANTLTVNAAATCASGLTVTGNISSNSSSCSGNSTVTGTQTITGLNTCGGLKIAATKLLTFGDATTQSTSVVVSGILPTLAASNTFTNATNTFNAITCSGLTLTGTHSITGSLSCTGNSQCGSSTVTGNETVGGTETITGMTNCNGGLTVVGLTTLASTAFGANIGLITTSSLPVASQLGFVVVGVLATNTALVSSTSVFTNLTSISLPAYGTYIVKATCQTQSTINSTTMTAIVCGLSSVSGTGNPNVGSFVSNYFSQTIPITGYYNPETIFIYSPATAITLYFNIRTEFTGTGTLSALASGTYIKAIRIA